MQSDILQAWCVNNYSSTDCVGIRNDAQDRMVRYVTVFYYVNAGLAICFAILVSRVFTLKSIESLSLYRTASSHGQDTREYHIKATDPEIKGVKCSSLVASSNRRVRELWSPIRL